MRISDWSSDVCSSDLGFGGLCSSGFGFGQGSDCFLFGCAVGGGSLEAEAVVSGFEDVAVMSQPVEQGDRKSVVWGKSVSVRVDLGGRRIIKKINNAL